MRKIPRYKFDEDFQQLILALMVQNSSFVVNYKDVLDPVFFTNPLLQNIAKIILNFIDQYSSLPSKESLIEEVKKLTSSNLHKDFKELYLLLVANIYKEQIQDAEFIQSEAIDFGKERAYSNALVKSAEILTERRFTKIQKIWGEAFLVGMDSMDTGYKYLENFEERTKERNLPFTKGIPLGFSEIDRRLKGDGILPGWLLFFMAPSNTGKSMMLQNVCINMLFNARKILYVTFEMTAEQTSDRLDSCLTGIPYRELKNKGELLKERVKLIRGDLEIKHYPMKTCSCNKITAYLDFLKKVKNFIPEIIIIDHADDMIPNIVTGDRFNDQSEIFSELITLGQTQLVPIITASQGNRGSFALQRNGENLGMDNSSGSIVKSQVAHVVISLIARPEDKFDDGTGIMQAAFIKNRDGPKDVTIPLEVDYVTNKIRIARGRVESKKKGIFEEAEEDLEVPKKLKFQKRVQQKEKSELGKKYNIKNEDML